MIVGLVSDTTWHYHSILLCIDDIGSSGCKGQTEMETGVVVEDEGYKDGVFSPDSCVIQIQSRASQSIYYILYYKIY